VKHLSKERIVIPLGVALYVCSTTLGLIVISGFVPLLGTDSVVPKAVAIISSFRVSDYLQILLSIGLTIMGVILFLWGIMLKSRRLTDRNSGTDG
jgi:hypothetical protein